MSVHWYINHLPLDNGHLTQCGLMSQDLPEGEFMGADFGVYPRACPRCIIATWVRLNQSHVQAIHLDSRIDDIMDPDAHAKKMFDEAYPDGPEQCDCC